MTFMKRCGPEPERASDDYGMRLVRTTSFGRKRVALSNICIDFDDDGGGGGGFVQTVSLKRRCFRDLFSGEWRSSLEDLPQEILIRIVCGVEHDDLKSLLSVSKTMRDATLIAKQIHFAYSTPRKTAKIGDNEVETPEAPKQSRAPRQTLSSKKLAGISVCLFASGDRGFLRPYIAGNGNKFIETQLQSLDC